MKSDEIIAEMREIFDSMPNRCCHFCKSRVPFFHWMICPCHNQIYVCSTCLDERCDDELLKKELYYCPCGQGYYSARDGKGLEILAEYMAQQDDLLDEDENWKAPVE